MALVLKCLGTGATCVESLSLEGVSQMDSILPGGGEFNAGFLQGIPAFRYLSL